ncbi:MAG: hypothetical protein JO047_11520 [Alphaproteobacteria bacterium]|nr:hypothetical protein [Alphaproteobacteria bacterium]
MALQLGTLNALRKAGLHDDLARQAAGEVAGYDNRPAGIERQLVELRAHMDERFAELRGYVDARVNRVNSLLGVLIALVIAVFVKQFFH